MSHSVKVSFLEIHNDDINDLLDTTPKTCTLREDITGSVLVSGLEEFPVKTAREVPAHSLSLSLAHSLSRSLLL